MQAIDEYIDKVRHLPAAPRVVPELMKLLRQPDVDSSKVVQLISFDPGLTTSVLRICNSAYFAAAIPTSDLQEAVTRLGFQQLYRLVTAASGARLLSSAQKGYGLDPGELWKHSVAAAAAAQIIAKKVGDDQNLAFTAGLLHDIGKIVLAESLESFYAQLVVETEHNQQTLLEAERKLLGVQHAEVGGRLLTRWRFAPNIVAAVWFHHEPQAAGTHQRLAANAYLGNLVAHFMGHGYGHQALALRGREEALSILELPPESLPQFMIEAFEQMNVIDSLLAAA